MTHYQLNVRIPVSVLATKLNIRLWRLYELTQRTNKDGSDINKEFSQNIRLNKQGTYQAVLLSESEYRSLSSEEWVVLLTRQE